MLQTPHKRACCAVRGSDRRGNGGQEGVTGIKYLGARELTYKLAFLACSTQVRRICVKKMHVMYRCSHEIDKF